MLEKKKIVVLVAMVLAVVLAAAVPALAQSSGTITATGVVTSAPGDGGPPVYFVTDEASGKRYFLLKGGVSSADFGAYEGKRVTVEGAPQTDPSGDFTGNLNVTNIGLAQQGGGTTGGGETTGDTSTTAGGTTGGGGTTAPSPSDGYKKVTQTFELTVEGDPPAGASFFGRITPPAGSGDGGGPSYVLLTDPDGDGLYTGSDFVNIPVPPRDSPPNPVNHPPTIQIVQGTGFSGPEAADGCSFNGCTPGEPIRIIKDFGVVPLDQDKTFSAKVHFNKGEQGGTTTPESTTTPVTTTPESTAPPESTTPQSTTGERTGRERTGREGTTGPNGEVTGRDGQVTTGGSSGGSNGVNGSGNAKGGTGGSTAAGAGGVSGAVSDAVSPVTRGRLPNTGGGWAVLLLVGAMLIGGGLLAIRLARRS